MILAIPGPALIRALPRSSLGPSQVSGKWVGVSPVRFSDVALRAGTLHASFRGAVGETVHVSFAAPGVPSKVVSVACRVGASGVATALADDKAVRCGEA